MRMKNVMWDKKKGGQVEVSCLVKALIVMHDVIMAGG
jgi:hypothetical protein